MMLKYSLPSPWHRWQYWLSSMLWAEFEPMGWARGVAQIKIRSRRTTLISSRICKWVLPPFMWPFAYRIHVFIFTFSAFFFFCPHLLTLGDIFYCCEQYIHCTLFTHRAYTVHVLKNIKNGSHDTIYTFKNYFATLFSVFSNNKFNPNTPIKPVTLQDLIMEAKIVKQEIKEDNSTDIDE